MQSFHTFDYTYSFLCLQFRVNLISWIVSHTRCVFNFITLLFARNKDQPMGALWFQNHATHEDDFLVVHNVFRRRYLYTSSKHDIILFWILIRYLISVARASTLEFHLFLLFPALNKDLVEGLHEEFIHLISLT